MAGKHLSPFGIHQIKGPPYRSRLPLQALRRWQERRKRIALDKKIGQFWLKRHTVVAVSADRKGWHIQEVKAEGK